MNALQAARFRKLAALFPDAKRSLANSAGAFLGEEPTGSTWCGRGSASTAAGRSSQTHPDIHLVARLEAPILQVWRQVAPGESVGYGATFVAGPAHAGGNPWRLATPTVWMRAAKAPAARAGSAGAPAPSWAGCPWARSAVDVRRGRGGPARRHGRAPGAQRPGGRGGRGRRHLPAYELLVEVACRTWPALDLLSAARGRGAAMWARV